MNEVDAGARRNVRGRAYIVARKKVNRGLEKLVCDTRGNSFFDIYIYVIYEIARRRFYPRWIMLETSTMDYGKAWLGFSNCVTVKLHFLR